MRASLRVKHYSMATERTYIGWVKRFIYFHGKRHPMDMGAAEVEAFLSSLAKRRISLRNCEQPLGFMRARTATDLAFCGAEIEANYLIIRNSPI